MKSKDEVDSPADAAIKLDNVIADPSQGASVPFDGSALPKSFLEMVGQKELVRRLTGLVELARRRGEVLGHALLLGPDGCGKRTAAHLIARELGVNLSPYRRHKSVPPAISLRSLMTWTRAMCFLSKMLTVCKKFWSRCFCPR